MAKLDDILSTDNQPAVPLAEPVDTETQHGRLPTGLVILNMARLGEHIKNSAEAYNKLPGAQPQEVRHILEEIINQLGHAVGKARKLLEANK